MLEIWLMASKAVPVDKALRQAKSLAKGGNKESARAAYQQILARFPGNTRALQGLQELGQPALKKGQDPNQRIAQVQALYRAGRLDEALALSEPVLKAFPDNAGMHRLTGNIRASRGDYEAAISHFRKAIKLAPGANGDAYVNLSDALNMNGQPEKAVDAARNAIPKLANPANAWNSLGNAERHLGHIEEAVAAFEKAIECNPSMAVTHRNLSMLKTYAPDDPQIAQMREQLASQGRPAERANLCFALAKAYEDTGRGDEAFDLILEGNRLIKSTLNYVPQMDAGLFARVASVFSSPVPQLEEGTIRPRPVFIIGMPRSGTTLVEQILASHSQVHGAGELAEMGRAVMPVMTMPAPALDEAKLRDVRQSYLTAIGKLGTDKPVIVDKMPLNFRWAGFILAAIPEATVIHMRRDPVATGYSIFRHFFPAGGLGFAWDLEDIAAFSEGHDRLMAFWHQKFPGRIHELNYEALTENQEAETRRLLEICGLEWEEACLDFHKTDRPLGTASSLQVRKEMYRGSSDAWRQHEDRLGPLLRLADQS